MSDALECFFIYFKILLLNIASPKIIKIQNKIINQKSFKILLTQKDFDLQYIYNLAKAQDYAGTLAFRDW